MWLYIIQNKYFSGLNLGSFQLFLGWNHEVFFLMKGKNGTKETTSKFGNIKLIFLTSLTIEKPGKRGVVHRIKVFSKFLKHLFNTCTV